MVVNGMNRITQEVQNVIGKYNSMVYIVQDRDCEEICSWAPLQLEKLKPSVYLGSLTSTHLKVPCKVIVFMLSDLRKEKKDLMAKRLSEGKFSSVEIMVCYEKDEELNQEDVPVHKIHGNASWISKNLFVTPVASSVVPFLDDFGKGANLQYTDLPENWKGKVMKVSSALVDLMKTNDLSCVSVYSIGKMSKFIGEDFQRRKTTGGHEKTCLIIVDRTLDLVGPMRHSNNLLDKLQSLRKVTPISSDIEISKKTTALLYSDIDSKLLSYVNSVRHGSLCHHGDEKLLSLLDTFATKPESESFHRVRSELLQICGDEGMKIVQSEKEILVQIQNLIHHICNNKNLLVSSRSFLRFIICLLELNSLKPDLYQLMQSSEMMIMLQIQEEDPMIDLYKLIGDVFKHQSFELTDILQLLILIYSMVSPEVQFVNIEKIQDLLLTSKSVRQISKEDTTLIFNQLQLIQQQRYYSKAFRSLISPSENKPYESIFTQLGSILTKNVPVEDVQECKNESVGNFITGSLSRFMFSSGNNCILAPEIDNLVIYSVGGICGEDIENFLQTFRKKVRVVFGGTRLVGDVSGKFASKLLGL